jgi:hypothetical protein
MKKKDIIQLVKKSIKEMRKGHEHDGYGAGHEGGRNSISGMPGVWEGESTSFKVVNIDTGKTIDFGIDQAKAEEIVAAAKEDNINAKVVKMKNVDDVGKLDEAGPSNNPYYNAIEAKAKKMGIHVKDYMKDLLKDKSEMEIVKMGYQDLAALAGVENLSEEGQSWGLDIRQLADSFTFEELEQLYNDNKITKEDLNGATGYLQSWIDQHPTYLPQRDLNTSKRQAIRSYYLDPDRTTPKGGTQSSQFEMHDFEKNYGDKIKADDFKNNEKLQPGKKVTYLGTSRTIAKNNGFILTLDNGTTVNLGQFNQKGAIKEKDMKRKNIKELDTKLFLGPDAITGLKKDKRYGSLAGDAKLDAEEKLKKGGGVELEEDEMDEMNYDDSGLENPKAADISKDGEISDYEQKRGLAIQNAMDDQEKNEMYTNDIGKDDYEDDEGRMAKSQMYKTGKYAMKLHDMLDDMEQLPAWVQAKLTKASDYLSAVYHYLDYEFVRRDSNLMEHVDKHKKRSMLMEGAMKKFFEMFDKGKTDEEIVQDYAHKGTQVPKAFVNKARGQYEGMKKLKLELEMSEKELRNVSEKMVNNAEEGMESPMEEKQLASRLK